MDSIGTRRGTRGGCWVIQMPNNLATVTTEAMGTTSASPHTTSYRRGFRTFLHHRQPPQTNERDDVQRQTEYP